MVEQNKKLCSGCGGFVKLVSSVPVLTRAKRLKGFRVKLYCSVCSRRYEVMLSPSEHVDMMQVQAVLTGGTLPY